MPVVAPSVLLDGGDRPLVRWLLPRLLVLLSTEELSSTVLLWAGAEDDAGVSSIKWSSSRPSDVALRRLSEEVSPLLLSYACSSAIGTSIGSHARMLAASILQSSLATI